MRFVLLLVAAVIAVVAGVAALQFSGKNQTGAPTATSQPQAASPSVSTVEVQVAREPIAVGTVITDAMIDRQPWPEHLVLEGMITADTSLVGKVARAPFAAREPFMMSKIANPNDPSFLAASLPEGMRAVSIATDAVSGVAGYVFPGDRVDILLTHNIPQELKEKRGARKLAVNVRRDKPELTEVLVPNVRVLAVNVRPPAGKEAQATIAPSNVTVEVGQLAMEKIRLAEKNGTLSLALRSIKDQEDKAVPGVMPVHRLTRVDDVLRHTPSSDAVRIVRGAGRENDMSPDIGSDGSDIESVANP